MPFKRNKQGSPREEEGADKGTQGGGAHAADPSSNLTNQPISNDPGLQTAVAVAEPGTVDDVGGAGNGAHAAVPPVGVAAPADKVAELSKGRLGNVLVQRGLVTEAQLDQGLAQQQETGGKIGEVLVEMGILDDRDLVDALSEFLGVPVSNLRRENVEPTRSRSSPRTSRASSMAVPIRLSDEGLDVAAAEPSEELRDLLSKTSGEPVR